MKKRTKIIISLLLILLIAVGAGGYAYINDYYRADADAITAMENQSGTETAEDGGVIWFIPENARAGLIFYPGGKVEYTAYAPLMRECAAKGILCALVHMPGNLAVLDANAADGLREKHPEIESWYIAGHSLGGAMAANYAKTHADGLKGLILLAAYSTKDISAQPLRVLSIYGSEDGVMNRASYEKYMANLPADTLELVLDGGCHAQFGSYGPQKGDGTPTISAKEQIRQTAEAISDFIDYD